jgi:primase-polymerase (primpol)-like protein
MKPINSDIHVPAEIRDLPIFLCWRLEAQYEGDTKPLKVPYYPNGGRRAGKQGSGEDRAKLTT